MQDAVVNVLQERQALSRPPRAAILLSLVFHLTIALLVTVSPAIQREQTKPIAINMRLAPSRASGAEGTRTTQRPRRAAQKAPPVETRPLPVEEKPQPEKVVEGRVDPVRTAEKSVFGKAPEPATPKRTGPPASGGTTAGRDSGIAPGEKGAFAVPGIGSAGVTGIEGGDFPYTIYIDRMTTRIGSNWFRPQTTGEHLAVVYFAIERNGTLRDVRVERSSGNRTFDRAAYRAVLESSPLPPLPMQYSGTHLGVHLTFH
jgi:TonB family protein